VNATDAERTARLLWQYGEPIHALSFFAPETQQATDRLGLKGGWMSYFACRAAPLGAVQPAVVTSIFYGFHRRSVERAIPDAWSYAEPATLVDARASAMDIVLHRVLGDAVDGDEMRRAASLAMDVVDRGDFSGRPLGAANAALLDPGPPHLQLWQALGAIREHRGDGHVACLVAHQIDPCGSLVLQAATGRSDADALRTRRGWSEDEWRDAVGRLQERGWIDDEGRITPAGRQGRESVESATDRLAADVVASNTQAHDLVEAIRPFAERVMSTGEVPALNNMGLIWPPSS
jgi:hypothetical protein